MVVGNDISKLKILHQNKMWKPFVFSLYDKKNFIGLIKVGEKSLCMYESWGENYSAMNFLIAEHYKYLKHDIVT